MTDTDTTEQTETNLAKITFSNGNYCYADIKYGQTIIDITSIKGLFDKNGSIISSNTFTSELINWDEEEINIDYNGSETIYMHYKGKINKFGEITGIGTLTCKNGDKYNGDFEKGQIISGTLTYKNGDKYEGNFKNWKFDGKGKVTYLNGYYISNFVNGIRHGKCAVYDVNGTVYDYYYENGKLRDEKNIEIIDGDLVNGSCKITIFNSEKKINRTIEGTIKNGIIDTGKNKFVLNNGDKYRGNDYENHTVNGKLNGICKIIYKNDAKHINRTIKADFIDGKPEEESSITFGEGDKYCSVDNDIINIVYKNDFDPNIIYKINEENWKLTGKGTLINKYGDNYEGEFEDGKPNGKGEFIWKNDYIYRSYEGEFEDGKPNGKGEFIYIGHNKKYVGDVKDGKPNGKGKYICYDEQGKIGYIKEGEFKDGDFKQGTRTNYENGKKLKVEEGEFDEKGDLFGEKCRKVYYDDKENKLKVEEGNFINGELDGKGTFVYVNGNKYVGEFKDGKRNGQGTLIYADGSKYEGEFKDGKRNGQGRYTIVEEETKKPLYTQVYDENGMMDKVEYLYEEGNSNKIVIDYRAINIALNNDNEEYLKDSKNYAYICDKDGNKLKNQEECNIKLIEICAQYQMQTRLKGSSGKLDDENRMDGARTGLQNLIVLSKLCDNINALKRVRFEIEQNNPDWPGNTYKDIESYLNSYGLTKNKNSLKENRLTSIHDLDIDYFSANITNLEQNHAISIVCSLSKIKQFLSEKVPEEEMGKIVIAFDSSGYTNIDDKLPEKSYNDADELSKKNFLNLQKYLEHCIHDQQGLGSCWYQASFILYFVHYILKKTKKK